MRWMVGSLAAISMMAAPESAVAQRPGELISAEPVTAPLATEQAWKIRYWTSDDRGPRQATAMVVAPRGGRPGEMRPVLAWTHGVWGVASKCAPSLSPNFWRWSAGLQGVGRGYTVVAPDYPGLDSPGIHPMLIGRPTAHSVLDAVRAARLVQGAGAGKRFAVWGESQGGHAALWTAMTARRYAPDLELVGAAASAPATYLLDNLKNGSDPSARTFLTAYALHSWSQYFGAPMSSVAGPQSRGIITRLSQNNCINFEAKPKLGTILGVLTLRNSMRNVDLGQVQPWSGYGRSNSPNAAQIEVPLLIAQNANDKIVAPAVTRRFAHDACAARKRVRWIDLHGKGHETSASDAAAATLDWIGARFAGTPAPSNCGKF